MNVVGQVVSHAPVEDDDRLVRRARALHRRRHRRCRVRRDHEGVAVALVDEVVDVGDLGVVGVLRVAGLHRRDDALVLQHLELLLHRDPAGLAPRVADRGVREADLLGAVGLEARRVGHLPVDVLQPRLLRVALERGAALLVLAVEVRLDEPLAVRCRGCAGRAGRAGRRRLRFVGAAARQDQHGRCCGRKWRRYGSSHQFSPVVAPWMGWVGCGGAVGAGLGAAQPQGALPGASGQGDGGDDDEALHGVPPGRRDAQAAQQQEQQLEGERSRGRREDPAATAAEDHAAEDDRGDRRELVARRRRRGARPRSRRAGSRPRSPTATTARRPGSWSTTAGCPE